MRKPTAEEKVEMMTELLTVAVHRDVNYAVLEHTKLWSWSVANQKKFFDIQQNLLKKKDRVNRFVAVEPFNWNHTSLRRTMVELVDLIKVDILGTNFLNSISLISDAWSVGKYKLQIYVLRFMKQTDYKGVKEGVGQNLTFKKKLPRLFTASKTGYLDRKHFFKIFVLNVFSYFCTLSSALKIAEFYYRNRRFRSRYPVFVAVNNRSSFFFESRVLTHPLRPPLKAV